MGGRSLVDCRAQGESVHPSIHSSVRLSVRPSIPPCPILRALSPLGPILTHILPNSPNPSNMAQIYAKWPISKQNGPNLTRKPQFWPEVHHFGPLDLCCGLCYLDSDQIWVILLRFGPYCLDLEYLGPGLLILGQRAAPLV